MNTENPEELILYELYDSRADYQDKEDCTLYDACKSLKEAKQQKSRQFTDAIIFKTINKKQSDGTYLEINAERIN